MSDKVQGKQGGYILGGIGTATVEHDVMKSNV